MMEIQGILYSQSEYQSLREIEEREALNFREQYKQEMYAEWVREPTEEVLLDVLGMFKSTLKKHGQSPDGILDGAVFSASFYMRIIQTLTSVLDPKTISPCPICGTPQVRMNSVLGKLDNAMRCPVNRFHYVADMAAEVMTKEQLTQVFGGTWLNHVITRNESNAIADAIARKNAAAKQPVAF